MSNSINISQTLTVRNKWPFDSIQINILLACKETLEADRWNILELPSSYWRIYSNNASGAAMKSNSDRTEMEANSVYLVPSYYNFSAENSQRFTQTYIHLSIGTSIPGVLSELFTKPFKVPDDNSLKHSISHLTRLLDHLYTSDVLVKCLALSIAFQVLTLSLEALSEEKRELAWALFAQVDKLIPAINVLDRSLTKQLSNFQLAKLCDMSEDHFIREFKKSVGLPPATYLLNRRVAAAAERLHFSDDSIEQIAEQTGFCDRSYFSRAFTKQIGLPPATYRRRCRIGPFESITQ